MTIISSWVSQIIIIIIIATILELLIPNNSMKKYVNIVFGLLLLLILTKPLLYLFSIDVGSYIEKIENNILFDHNMLSETETLLQNQKKEIQAEQAAYIWNEVKLQMMNQANPVLKEQYDAEITDISFNYSTYAMDDYDKINEITVSLTTNKPTNINDSVEPIVIETKQEAINKPTQSTKIIQTLRHTWNLHKEKIEIIWEGGTT